MSVVVMTAYKQGQGGEENVIRIDRVAEEAVDRGKIHYVAQGPLKGIAVNKAASEGLPSDDGAPNVRMDFIASLWRNTEQPRNGPEKREKRELRFWFKDGAERPLQVCHAKAFFRHLVKPEQFPRDYVHFIKKAVILVRHFRSLTRVDVVLQPAGAPPESPPEPEADDTLERAKLRRERARVDARRRMREDLEESSDEEWSDYREMKEKLIDNFITVLTPAKYDYQYLPEVTVSKKKSIVFRVRAKADAHIALSSVYGDTEQKTYEIVIGGWNNAKSVIRHGGQGKIVKEAVTPKILNGYEYRTFWISWGMRKLSVGEGSAQGMKTFLTWDIPKAKKYSINCIAVSTGQGSEGTWEFVEKILPDILEDTQEAKKLRRSRVCTALLWYAKKQRMLQVLEEAYPNVLQTPHLLRRCNVKMRDMMFAVVLLKDLQRRALISEVSKGVWVRSSTAKMDTLHEVKRVEEFPVFAGREAPSIAIVTSLFCEKLAVDAMMQNKMSYVKYQTEGGGEGHVYTLGYIGHRHVVTTKLSRLGASREATIANENAITRLLGTFPQLSHVFLVGVGGAVPHYTDYWKHVRLGDIVVSMPTASSGGQGSLYYHCDKVGQKTEGRGYEFATRAWKPADTALQTYVAQLRTVNETDSYVLRPWMKYLEKAKSALSAEEANYNRPPSKSDRLFALIGGERVHIEHPRPVAKDAGLHSDTQPNLRYGPVGSAKFVARNEQLRRDFAESAGLLAYDGELQAVLEALEGSRVTSYILVRGIADYVDGTVNRDWQPYAALCAAAYTRTLIGGLPSAKPY